jgi:membrane protease YdiL (CAAX protease family)
LAREAIVSALIKVHPVLSYYVLAFAVSWTAILVLVGPEGFVSTTGDSPTFALVGLGALLGPALAGILMTGVVDGRAGFRELLSRLRRWRVGIRWYAIALLTAPLLTIANLLALSLTSPGFAPAILTTDDKAGLLWTALTTGLMVPVFEEIGWTGFATPRLRRSHGVLATGVIMGALWGAWHLPLFAGTAASSGAIPPLLFLAAMLFSWLIPYRILMVWVYDRTRSLLVAMLMHTPIVISQYVLRPMAISAEATFVSLLTYGAALWLVVGVVALVNEGHLTPYERARPA